MGSRWLVAVLVLALLVGVAATSGAQVFVVVPNDFENVEGPTSRLSPFSTLAAPSARYQQVYEASQFPSGEVLIQAIAFRPDVAAKLVETSYDLEIRLSTTELAPDSLSSTFATNIGVDETLVFDGMITLSTTAAGAPKDFVVSIPLVSWFPYDRALGNLLFDLRILNNANLSNLDAVSAADSVSRVTTDTGSQTADSATGSADSAGLVTRFTVPEPAGLLPGIAAGLAFATRVARRRG